MQPYLEPNYLANRFIKYNNWVGCDKIVYEFIRHIKKKKFFVILFTIKYFLHDCHFLSQK